LADANKRHDWRIYVDFAQTLIGIARPMYAEDPFGVDLQHSLYALESTTIDLCLSMFPWAKFRKHKAAVKMHTLLDQHGNIPTFISISGGKVPDVKVLDDIMPEAGAFYGMDRGLRRFRASLQVHAQFSLFCRVHKIECSAAASLLSPSRQDNRLAFGSDGDSDHHWVGD